MMKSDGGSFHVVRCADCKHWGDGHVFGKPPNESRTCVRISGANERDPAFAWDCDRDSFQTKADFGCVLFTEKD
jgi:hypothetical protein